MMTTGEKLSRDIAEEKLSRLLYSTAPSKLLHVLVLQSNLSWCKLFFSHEISWQPALSSIPECLVKREFIVFQISSLLFQVINFCQNYISEFFFCSRILKDCKFLKQSWRCQQSHLLNTIY